MRKSDGYRNIIIQMKDSSLNDGVRGAGPDTGEGAGFGGANIATGSLGEFGLIDRLAEFGVAEPGECGVGADWHRGRCSGRFDAVG